MVEEEKFARNRTIVEYKVIFNQYPDLKTLAQGYWSETKILKPSPESFEKEGKILTETITQMVEVLLESPLFLEAIEKADGDPLESAIIESLRMIDIVPNV